MKRLILAGAILLTTTIHSLAQVEPRLFKWEYLSLGGGNGTATVSNADGITLEVHCRDGDSLIKMVVGLPISFTSGNKDVVLKVSSNSEATLAARELELNKNTIPSRVKKIDREKAKYRWFRTVLNWTANSTTTDFYEAYVHETHQGLTMLRIMRDAIGPIALKAIVLSGEAGEFSGSVTVTSTGSTASFSSLNTNHCGL